MTSSGAMILAVATAVAILRKQGASAAEEQQSLSSCINSALRDSSGRCTRTLLVRLSHPGSQEMGEELNGILQVLLDGTDETDLGLLLELLKALCGLSRESVPLPIRQRVTAIVGQLITATSSRKQQHQQRAPRLCSLFVTSLVEMKKLDSTSAELDEWIAENRAAAVGSLGSRHDHVAQECLNQVLHIPFLDLS